MKRKPLLDYVKVLSSLVNENAPKKRRLILSKWILHIVYLGLPMVLFGQTKSDPEVKKVWQELRKKNEYLPNEKYQGPERNVYSSPTTINENEPGSQGSVNPNNQPYQGLPYSAKDIQRGRQVPQNPGSGSGGSGTLQSDPNIAPAEGIDIPEIDSQESDSARNSNLGKTQFSGEFWKIIGIILLLLALAFIIYSIIKNRTPRDKTIPFEPLEEDLNPATISKTELELRLEEAIATGNYKECVRIYFLFAMKDLIERRWIFWKKEKTNMHYIIELQGKPAAFAFEEIVKIYDLVWYGDYAIDKTTYEMMAPTLDRHYKSIEALQ